MTLTESGVAATTAPPRTRGEQEDRLATTRSNAVRVLATNVGWALIALALASVVVFFSLHYLPGDQAAIIGGTDASPAQLAEIRHAHGWDRPVVVQYLDWAGHAVRGDFGTSALSGQGVGAELGVKLQVTLPLAAASLTLAVAAALVLGVLAAARAHTWPGRLVSWITQLGLAIPSYIVGIGLVAVVAIPSAGLLPATGFPRQRWGDPAGAVRSLILPVITLTLPQCAVLIRYVRSAVLEQIDQDYMRTARAQGMTRDRALITQALRNACLPLLSVIALDAAALLMGTVVVEQVFALPGVGYHLLTSVSNRDITMVQGFLMALSATVIVLMMLSNVAAQLLDPRVRVR